MDMIKNKLNINCTSERKQLNENRSKKKMNGQKCDYRVEIANILYIISYILRPVLTREPFLICLGIGGIDIDMP